MGNLNESNADAGESLAWILDYYTAKLTDLLSLRACKVDNIM